MSRQREWQKRMRAEGKCAICGAKAAPSRRKGQNGKSSYCPKHLKAQRERNRRTHGSTRRNVCAVSYTLEGQDDSEES